MVCEGRVGIGLRLFGDRGGIRRRRTDIDRRSNPLIVIVRIRIYRAYPNARPVPVPVSVISRSIMPVAMIVAGSCMIPRAMPSSPVARLTEIRQDQDESYKHCRDDEITFFHLPSSIPY